MQFTMKARENVMPIKANPLPLFSSVDESVTMAVLRLMFPLHKPPIVRNKINILK